MKQYTKQFINGEWIEGRGEPMQNENPYSGEVIYSYRAAGREDVDAAYTAAAAAQPAWAATLPAHKRAMLSKLYEAFESLREDIVACTIEEGGKTAQMGDFEYNACLDITLESMRCPYMVEGRTMLSDIEGKENYVFRAPKGVIGVVAPWNVPFALALRSVIPAVGTGNTVVLKPSSDTPGTAFVIAEAFERAGFPAGVVNVVAGRGSVIGDYFIEHPVPALISFTGSTEVGRRVGMFAGQSLKDVSLELGGNNVMIVLEDADLEQAANAAIFGKFFNQGQICMAINRIIVCEKVHDAFLDIFVEKVRRLKTGPLTSMETDIGALMNRKQVENVERIVADTIAAGASVALEGQTQGCVVTPWILSDVKNDMAAASNEVFGPVCSVIKAETPEQAVALANDTEYGLSGCVFTADIYRGMQIARQVKTGMFHVNDQSINSEQHVVFGGEKASGVGRFNGEWVAAKFTTEKWVSVQTKPRFG